MNLSKAINSKFYCSVCEVFIASKANYALHVLTMEHCENFSKVSKRKPKSTENEGTKSDLEMSKATPTTVADKLYSTNEDVKEMDCVKCDWFWGSLAENNNEQVFPESDVINSNSTTVPSFCKTITKSLISCEVCNVILTKIVDYECHIKSSRHIWNMKLRGMGVSHEFVKSDTKSCKINADELSTNGHQVEQNDSKELIPLHENLALIPFPLLYCDACELLLNTFQQFNTHVNGKLHKLCVRKKGKMKVKKIRLPSPNKYYCYSCKLILNSCLQYNEHKRGKKHKIRCAQLVGMGIAIPPEEQLTEWNLPKVNPGKPVSYPEFYERFVLVKQKGELEKYSKLKAIMMNENECGQTFLSEIDRIKMLGITSPTHISELKNLNTLKTEAILQHIYRIKNDSQRTA